MIIIIGKLMNIKSPKSISSGDSSGEQDNIVMKLNDEQVSNDIKGNNNFIKIKLDDVPEPSKHSI